MEEDAAADFSPTARSVVVARLREEILSGRTPYGTRLRQGDVASRFGISTTPVREAFRELATLGLVEIQAHRGAVVLRPSAEELAHIYEVRALLEPVSVAWSSQRITPGQLDKAWKIIELMREPATPDVAATLNRRFHAVIADACGNQHLSELVINLLDLSTPYIVRVVESSNERTKRQNAEHEEILRACASGDPKRAYEASVAHLTQLHLKVDEDGAKRQPIHATFDTRWLPFDLATPRIAPSSPTRRAKTRRSGK
jgi:DNA-binding GntR family transcriptional regulator